jgi:lipopolysaccharide/colanic/teichoic acid biosynthesis glycosyltransferase
MKCLNLLMFLKGDMSIVGPRPHMVEHDIHYSIYLEFLKRHKANQV